MHDVGSMSQAVSYRLWAAGSINARCWEQELSCVVHTVGETGHIHGRCCKQELNSVVQTVSSRKHTCTMLEAGVKLRRTDCG